MSEPLLQQRVARLLRDLVDEKRGAEGARELASFLGAEALLIFIPDFELDVLLPAPGFPQTLPEGREWRGFLERCSAVGEARAELPSPFSGERQPVEGRRAEGGAVIAVIGGQPSPVRLRAATDLLPLAAAALEAEQQVQAARAEARVESASAERAEASRAALDGARRQLQEALAAANRAREGLEQALRARDEFLSAASHELRNPIHSLRLQLHGLLTMIDRDGAPMERQWLSDRLRRIDRQGDRLAEHVDHLLDVSSLQAGGLPVELEELDLVALVGELIEGFEGQARPGQITYSGPASLVGCWDRLRLDQLISNLLSNALKYGQGGAVELTLEAGGEDAVELVVRDHGPGIPERDRRRIFERFTRAHDQHHQPGFGLGLWIAKRALETLGGEIEIENAASGGSRFRVRLPRTVSCPDLSSTR